MSKGKDIVRLTKIVLGYENLLDYILSRGFYISREEITTKGVHVVLSELRTKIILSFHEETPKKSELSILLNISRPLIDTVIKGTPRNKKSNKETARVAV